MSPPLRSTPLTRANPLVLLAVGLLAVVASGSVRTVTVGFVSVAVIACLAALLVPGLSRGARRVVAPAVGAASVAFSTWLLAGHDAAITATAGLRVLVLALPGVLLAPLIDPSRLGDYLAQRLHLPARPVAAVTASLLRFEQLAETWEQLDRTRRVRGLGPTRNPVSRLRHAAVLTVGLLVATLRGAASMAVAMDARGFAGAATRTWAEPAPWSRTDSGVLLAAAALTVLPYALPVWL